MSYFANECYICKSAESLKICGGCNMISYCGWNHQRMDWPNHKKFCSTISSIKDEEGVSHIYEKLRDSDSDTWCKERDRVCQVVKSKLDRDLHLHEEQMLLMPRSCFVCHDTREESLTTCPGCSCVNFCEKHPSSSEHDRDCCSMKLSHDLDRKLHDPIKFRILSALVDEIVERTNIDDPFDIPASMKDYLDEKITTGDHVLKQAFTSNVLSQSLTLYNTVNKLKLQSASEMLLHIRCDFPQPVVWELLLHFLPDLKFLKVIFVEQHITQTLKIRLCDNCTDQNKRLILQTKERAYKDYAKDELFKKPDIFAYLQAEISKDPEEVSEWQNLLEVLSRIGCPLVFTSVTETKSKQVSANLKSTFWPTPNLYEGLNVFGGLDPLREWTDSSIGRINQFMIVIEGRKNRCKAGILSSSSILLLKKEAGDCWDPQYFYYPHICRVCREENITIMCKYCSMVFYCSELHRREDWFYHKDICKVVQKLLIETGLKNVFDGELDSMGVRKVDSESWLRAKLNVLSKVESCFDTRLLVFEQQMFLFPKTCFICHEGDLSQVHTCICGTTLCKSHRDSRAHKSLCKDFDLSFLLVENEQIIDPLPEFSFSPGVEELPSSMQDFLELHLMFTDEVEVTNVQKIVIAELLTNSLTLLCAIKKLMIKKPKDDVSLVVHIVGSRNAEYASDEFWEVFFYWIRSLEKLTIIFLGSETKELTYNRSYSFDFKPKERNLIMKSYPLEYEQFVQSSFFKKPDAIVGFNLDIHECESEDANCSCIKNILAIRKTNFPFIMTSGSKERAQKDHKRLSKILDAIIRPDFAYLNPFASLEPARDFETEGLRYSNKYILIYSKWTRGSTEKEDIFSERSSESTRSLELEKKLAEMVFTKVKIQPDEDLDHEEEQKMEEDKLLGSQASQQKQDQTEKIPEYVPRVSSVFAASSELKYMLRTLKSDPKPISKNAETKFKQAETSENTVQNSQSEEQVQLESFGDRQKYTGIRNTKVIKLETDEELEEKCREVFLNLLAEAELENEVKPVENLDSNVSVNPGRHDRIDKEAKEIMKLDETNERPENSKIEADTKIGSGPMLFGKKELGLEIILEKPTEHESKTVEYLNNEPSVLSINKSKTELSETGLATRIGYETKIESGNSDSEKSCRLKNASNEMAMYSDSIKNLERVSTSFGNFEYRVEKPTEIKSTLKSLTTGKCEPSVPISDSGKRLEDLIKNAATSRTENGESTIESSKIRGISCSRTAPSNVRDANSELKHLLKNLKCLPDSSISKNVELATKQNGTLETNSVATQGSKSEEDIVEIRTKESKVKSVGSLNYETNSLNDDESRVEESQQHVSESNEKNEYSKNQLQKMSLDSRRELTKIILGNETISVANTKSKPGVEITEGRMPVENEILKSVTDLVPESDTSSSILAMDSELKSEKALNVGDFRLEEQLFPQIGIPGPNEQGNSEKRWPKSGLVSKEKLEVIPIQEGSKLQKLECEMIPKIECAQSLTAASEDLKHEKLFESKSPSIEEATTPEPEEQVTKSIEKLPKVFSVLEEESEEDALMIKGAESEGTIGFKESNKKLPQSENTTSRGLTKTELKKEEKYERAEESKLVQSLKLPEIGNRSSQEATKSESDEGRELEGVEKLKLLENLVCEEIPSTKVAEFRTSPERKVSVVSEFNQKLEIETAINRSHETNCKTATEHEILLNRETIRSAMNDDQNDQDSGKPRGKSPGVLEILEKGLKHITFENEETLDDNFATELELESKEAKPIEYEISHKPPGEESSKSESEPLTFGNKKESGSVIERIEPGKQSSTENELQALNSSRDKREPVKDDLVDETSSLKEMIMQLMMKEELIKAENSRLKEEISRFKT